MAKRLVLVAVVNIITTTADRCIAINQSVTGCSDCLNGPNDRIQGNECVRSGAQWYACYTTADACCDDPQISWKVNQSQCVANYSPSELSPTDEPTPEAITDCDKVVAKTSNTNNTKCQAKCQSIVAAGGSLDSDSDFASQCMIEHYTWANGRAQMSGKCFDSWVHGYIEPSTLAGYRTEENVKTPALCQKICQDDDDCVRFAWITPEGASGNSYANSCILKNRAQVEIPGTILYPTDDNPSNWDQDYCNYQTHYQCYHGYRCAPCEGGVKSCIWGTDEHVLGWKYCPASDVCKIPEPDDFSSTIAPPKVTTLTEIIDITTSITTLDPTTPTAAPTIPATTTSTPPMVTTDTTAPTTTAECSSATTTTACVEVTTTRELSTITEHSPPNNVTITLVPVTKLTFTPVMTTSGTTNNFPITTLETQPIRTTTQIKTFPTTKSIADESVPTTKRQEKSVTADLTSGSTQPDNVGTLSTEMTVTVSSLPVEVCTGCSENSAGDSNETCDNCGSWCETDSSCGACDACGRRRLLRKTGDPKAHGIDLRVHERPTRIRIAVDN